MTLNERLAVFAGWEYVENSDYAYKWRPPGGNWFYPTPPPFSTDRNLIAEELLPRLTEEQWARLNQAMCDTAIREGLAENPGKFFLTLPPADLAAAIAEVVES